MVTYIGIDPGNAGGMAWKHDNDKVCAHKLTTRDADHLRLWDIIIEEPEELIVIGVEAVHSMPKQGVTSSFNFGDAFGHAKSLGIVAALNHRNVTWELITPQRWQKYMGLIMPKGTSKTDKKNKHKVLAASYTDMVVTHAVADAILIAQYCYEVRNAK